MEHTYTYTYDQASNMWSVTKEGGNMEHTYTYQSVDAVSAYRNRVTLSLMNGSHVHYLTIEIDTATLTNSIGLMFMYPIKLSVDVDQNVLINGKRYGTFKKLSLKK